MLYSKLCEVYEELEKNPGRLKKTEILAELLKKIKKEEKEIFYLLRGRIFPDYDSREIGISEQLAIKALSKATGISDKEIVKKWKSTGDLGLVAEQTTSKKKQATLHNQKLTTEKVLENLQKLPELVGKGTVDKKMGLVAELLTSASGTEAKYLIRTLLADLRIGLGEGVLRDAIVWAFFDKENKEDYTLVQEAYDKATDFALVFEKALRGKKAFDEIELTPGKPVKVMLFPKVSSFEEAFEIVGKPAIIDFKYDGFRMMINKQENGALKIFTRRLEEVTNQFPDVIKYIENHVNAKSFILDCEAVGYNPKTKKYTSFQHISQRIKRKYDIEKLEKELPIEVVVFDILYYNGKNLISEPYKERRAIIEKIIKPQHFKIRTSEHILTSSVEEAEKFYKRALKEEQEGVMIKGLDCPYKPGARVGYGVKFKPEGNEFDLVIIKAEYGTGKRAGWLTSYTVACRDEEGKLQEIGKVSTGLKEKEEEGLSFMELTKLLKPLIKSEHGKEIAVKPEIIITVAYQNVQHSPTYSSGFALRFPRIKALRPDRSIHDIATIKEIEKESSKSWKQIDSER